MENIDILILVNHILWLIGLFGLFISAIIDFFTKRKYNWCRNSLNISLLIALIAELSNTLVDIFYFSNWFK